VQHYQYYNQDSSPSYTQGYYSNTAPTSSSPSQQREQHVPAYNQDSTQAHASRSQGHSHGAGYLGISKIKGSRHSNSLHPSMYIFCRSPSANDSDFNLLSKDFQKIREKDQKKFFRRGKVSQII
jgi:hypothetical protein